MTERSEGIYFSKLRTNFATYIDMFLIRKYLPQYVSRSAWPNRPSLGGRSASPWLVLQNLVLGSTITLLILFSIFSPLTAGAAITIESGFIQENIWYSKEPLVEGDTVKIYTIIFNTREEKLLGTVEFYDKNIILGKEEITVEPGTFKDASVSWNVTFGDHIISARLLDTKIIKADGTEESVFLKYNKTGEDKLFVSKKITVIEDIKEKKEELGEFIKENTPDIVEETFSKITFGLNAWREETGDKLDEKVEEIKAQLEKIKIEEEKEAPEDIGEVSEEDILIEDKIAPLNKIKKPFTYVKLWFLQLFSFIFARKFLFYLLLALITFLVLKFIWKRLRRSRY